jgi:hypothetical protein
VLYSLRKMKRTFISLDRYLIRILVLIVLVVESSCSNQGGSVAIHPKLVFSELDTFVTSSGNTMYNKEDYYLIKSFSKDKEYMKTVLDSFIKIHPEFTSSRYGNYLVSFYLEDSELNETVLSQTEKGYRYKVFTYKQDENFIACYCFWNSQFLNIDWNHQYYK